ncbi:Os07g0578050, partial [Oryza sativa Japonica Group]
SSSSSRAPVLPDAVRCNAAFSVRSGASVASLPKLIEKTDSSLSPLPNPEETLIKFVIYLTNFGRFYSGELG